ncbi:hypothetical protein N7462_009195 [Penicillium macrosclerotiorum]|uniref:uncharacterized protein n=1 Tax=Penicillium macrosclerotiorum TaxID=303699 RepID=UPI00254847D3|nr:uncharacterized protein N7462_009195 [Penicillium macrosclerotiorum]KAJ5673756.1 hypothetical protein N7462_009195 [Penicillium macrosclerotiorum]
MLAPNFQLNSVPPPLPVNDTPTYSPGEVPSCGGHGTLEILAVTRFLESRGIECCIVGVSALIFYGAGRVRDEWELCVPDNRVDEVAALLSSDLMADQIHPMPPHSISHPFSLSHTYHRFKGCGIHFYFVLMPAHDAHIPYGPFPIQRSLNGLPYPTLPVLMQSFLDMNDDVSLCDCIDGSNVSEEWGRRHLDLDGTNDLQWTAQMNKVVKKAAEGKGWLFVYYFPTQTINKRDKWESRVRNKAGRLGWTTPEHLFATRFRLKGSPDPWTQKLMSC